MALTDRIAVLIDAKTGGAVSEVRRLSDSTQQAATRADQLRARIADLEAKMARGGGSAKMANDLKTARLELERTEASASKLAHNPLLMGAGAAAVTAGAYALVRGLQGGLRELTDAQVGLAQTNAALRSTGGIAGVTADHVGELASKLQAMTGQTDDAVVGAENLLLTFTNIRNVAGEGNDVFDRATKLTLDLSQAFGQDLRTSAIQLGKALNDPVAGVTALTRAGVQFSESQKRQIKTLVDTGQLLDAQKIILGELNREVGGSAKAFGETLPGKMARSQRAIEDMEQSLVSGLSPALEKAADAATVLAQHSGLLTMGAAAVAGSAGLVVATKSVTALRRAIDALNLSASNRALIGMLGRLAGPAAVAGGAVYEAQHLIRQQQDREKALKLEQQIADEQGKIAALGAKVPDVSDTLAKISRGGQQAMSEGRKLLDELQRTYADLTAGPTGGTGPMGAAALTAAGRLLSEQADKARAKLADLEGQQRAVNAAIDTQNQLLGDRNALAQKAAQIKLPDLTGGLKLDGLSVADVLKRSADTRGYGEQLAGDVRKLVNAGITEPALQQLEALESSSRGTIHNVAAGISAEMVRTLNADQTRRQQAAEKLAALGGEAKLHELQDLAARTGAAIAKAALDAYNATLKDPKAIAAAQTTLGSLLLGPSGGALRTLPTPKATTPAPGGLLGSFVTPSTSVQVNVAGPLNVNGAKDPHELARGITENERILRLAR